LTFHSYSHYSDYFQQQEERGYFDKPQSNSGHVPAEVVDSERARMDEGDDSEEETLHDAAATSRWWQTPAVVLTRPLAHFEVRRRRDSLTQENED
jgi:hypothetical protein